MVKTVLINAHFLFAMLISILKYDERENNLIGFIMAIVIMAVAFSVAVVSLGVYEILRQINWMVK